MKKDMCACTSHKLVLFIKNKKSRFILTLTHSKFLLLALLHSKKKKPLQN